MAALGQGHRTIARELDLPPSTVRNWLRRARARAEWLRQRAVRIAREIDGCATEPALRPTPLGGALEQLGITASAAIRRFGWTHLSPWRIVAALTGGKLLAAYPDG
jgi:hypothetical protein